MIFYFTATGNSKYLAEKLAMHTSEKIVDIAECLQNDKYHFDISDGESVGFITPVYFYGIPMIVNEFLRKVTINAKDFYSYAILNCGGSTGNADKILRKAYQTDAVFAIVVVDNYVPLLKVESQEVAQQKLNKADVEIERIYQHIENKDKGIFNNVRGKLAGVITAFAYPMYTKGRKTSKFKVNSDCIGCGKCAAVCPRKIIKLVDGKPVWTAPQCELCLACLHRCPTKAINKGNSAKNGRYVNPRTKL